MLTFPDGPLFVLFSGGRDSSLVLAHATRWQRQRGLPDPVPITNRFPGDPGSYEDDWQEMVIRHLGLTEWVKLVDPDVDMLGANAQRLLVGGPFWPPNVTTAIPAADVARGGTLLTGLDGDGLLGEWRWARHRARARHLARAPWRARRADLRLATLAAPSLAARRSPSLVQGLHWLSDAGRQEYDAIQRAEARTAPRSWGKWLAWYPTQRHLVECCSATDRVGELCGSRVVHPLMSASVLAGLSAHAGLAEAGRSALTGKVAEGLLPETLLSRASKAEFTTPLWGERARNFVESWDGRLLPEHEGLVHAASLQEEWHKPSPHFGSTRWLHSAWLVANPQN